MISSIVECRISEYKNLKRSKMLKATSRSFSDASLRQIANFDVHIKHWVIRIHFKIPDSRILSRPMSLLFIFCLFWKSFEYWVSECDSVEPSEPGNRTGDSVAIVSSDFDRFVQPVSIKGADYVPSGFSHLPSAQLSLLKTKQGCLSSNWETYRLHKINILSSVRLCQTKLWLLSFDAAREKKIKNRKSSQPISLKKCFLKVYLIQCSDCLWFWPANSNLSWPSNFEIKGM